MEATTSMILLFFISLILIWYLQRGYQVGACSERGESGLSLGNSYGFSCRDKDLVIVAGCMPATILSVLCSRQAGHYGFPLTSLGEEG